MLIIRAKEGNDNLSYVLRKNPQTSLDKGGFKQAVGTGVYHGYFPVMEEGVSNNPIKDLLINAFKETCLNCPPDKFNEFHLRFIPSKDREELGAVEQFPIAHIADPSIIKGLISSLLRSAWKEPLDIDGPVELEFFLYTRKNLQAFGIPLKANSNAYRVKQEFPTLFQGLNWLLALTYYLTDGLSKEDCTKAAINCNNAGLGYHPRYLISRMTPYHQMFNTDSINLHGGPTHLQWRKAICGVLKTNPSGHLIDLGAGSLYVIKKLVGLYEKITAVDEEFGYKTKRKAEDMEIHLVESLIQDWQGQYEGTDVILCEVLEHNPLEVALNILTKVLEGNPNKVVITVPNKSFNENFNNNFNNNLNNNPNNNFYDENGMRHPDHYWEPTWEEFDNFLPSVSNYDCVIKGIGDKVNDVHISLMAVYEIRN